MTSLLLNMLLPFIYLTSQRVFLFSFSLLTTVMAYHSHSVMLNSFDLVSKIYNSQTWFCFVLLHLLAKYECTSVSALCLGYRGSCQHC